MPTETVPASSARREELLEKAYGYVLEHGLAGMSLRPLAAAVQSSPRVLLFLFESKDALVRTLLARARADEVRLLKQLEARSSGGLTRAAGEIWGWLVAAEHRGLLRLWLESYSRSLLDPAGPWSGFADATVQDWLALLAEAQPASERDTATGLQRRTLALALLRGALLDLLASGDEERTTGAVRAGLAQLDAANP
ncbi:MAG TPA: TetR/AcrR family transcriptional regulator [Solirubrobacteraceae bacterium]|jgi:AcrR family transcriptional regulator|nr:TetR/AcrR family transcriptional regulator [Solirubrobacteraceae bacterium]